MPMNRVQFQAGLSLPDFLTQYGTEAQCVAALERARWRDGFRCPRCDHSAYYRLKAKNGKTLQCRACRHQVSLLAGTLFESTKLALTVWFLAIFLISQAKTGLSALALKRQLGVSYPTAWLIHHKLMQAMVERDAGYSLSGLIQIDDAYLGGEFPGGKAGRGSENKVPFVAAVSLNDQGHPIHAKLSPVPGFTRKAIAAWADTCLAPGSLVVSDGLACWAGVVDAGSQHAPEIVGGRHPKDLPGFRWINTVLSNVKTSLHGAYHAFKFNKYAERYLGAIAYRFNRRFGLAALPARLLRAAVTLGPRPERILRLAADSC